jgi:Rieske Fe-S protein
MSDRSTAGPTRRAVVIGAGTAAVGAGLLVAGCSTAQPTAAEPAAPATGPLGPTSDVPVGSAKIFADKAVVVTQPTAGSFSCFSTACPHQGCAVSTVTDATIVCPCHGSTFALDGSVVKGPAAKGLASREVTVSGDQLTLT